MMQETNEKQIAAARLKDVYLRLEKAVNRYGPGATIPELIAVSKTQSAEKIVPFLYSGHRVFGENRVQEASGKWPELKQRFENIKLHLIGPLQTNKVKEAVKLFDVIETLDREKIVTAIHNEMEKTGKKLPCFVQVNIGREPQKSGVAPDQVAEFVAWAQKDVGLDVSGLMCIPPFDEAPGPYFAQLNGLAKQVGVKNISMGMSSDFSVAAEMGATHVRVGTLLFGARPPVSKEG